jgi:hypothetical protein
LNCFNTIKCPSRATAPITFSIGRQLVADILDLPFQGQARVAIRLNALEQKAEYVWHDGQEGAPNKVIDRRVMNSPASFCSPLLL